MDTCVAFLLFLVVLLQIADVWTTVEILDKGGVEKNPVLAAFMAKAGVVPALLLTKLVFLGGVWVAYYGALTGYVPWSGLKWAMTAITLIYVLVIANNLRELVKHPWEF